MLLFNLPSQTAPTQPAPRPIYSLAMITERYGPHPTARIRLQYSDHGCAFGPPLDFISERAISYADWTWWNLDDVAVVRYLRYCKNSGSRIASGGKVFSSSGLVTFHAVWIVSPQWCMKLSMAYWKSVGARSGINETPSHGILRCCRLWAAFSIMGSTSSREPIFETNS